MSSLLDEILQALASAQRRGDFEECITLCREGARLASPETEEWYIFRINLARFLLADMNKPSSRNVEEAMKVYLQLTASLTKEGEAKKRAVALVGLGWVYYLRIKGELRDNLGKAVKAFTEALTYYTRENDPYTWASIKAALGLVYSSLYNGNYTYLSEAIKNYEDALLVLTALEYPEDWKEITDKLNKLRKGEREKKKREKEKGTS